MVEEQEETNSKKKRPTGRDKAKQQAADVQVVKKAIAENAENKVAAAPKPTESIGHGFVNLLKNVGEGFLTQMSEDADANFASLLDEEDRKTWTKELFKTCLTLNAVSRRSANSG